MGRGELQRYTNFGSTAYGMCLARFSKWEREVFNSCFRPRYPNPTLYPYSSVVWIRLVGFRTPAGSHVASLVWNVIAPDYCTRTPSGKLRPWRMPSSSRNSLVISITSTVLGTVLQFLGRPTRLKVRLRHTPWSKVLYSDRETDDCAVGNLCRFSGGIKLVM